MEKQYETVSLDDLATLCNAAVVAVKHGVFDITEVGKVSSAYERVYGFALFMTEQHQAQEAAMNKQDPSQSE